MNFYLCQGIYLRRQGDTLQIMRSKEPDEPGELLGETDINGFSSAVASLSPWQEQNGSFDYIYDFLSKGVMYCGGCGVKITPESPQGAGGRLSIININACKSCYEQKFKPLFDWGLEIGKK